MLYMGLFQLMIDTRKNSWNYKKINWAIEPKMEAYKLLSFKFEGHEQQSNQAFISKF